jgi:hypothetical protein
MSDTTLTGLEKQIAEINLKEANKHTSHSTLPQNEPTPLPATDWQKVAEAQAEQIKHLENVITTGKLQPLTPHPNRDAKPATTAAQLRAQWGDKRFLHQATREEKIAAFGENPAAIQDSYLKACFGRGNSGAEASELMKRDPLRYRTLCEISKVLGFYAA